MRTALLCILAIMCATSARAQNPTNYLNFTALNGDNCFECTVKAADTKAVLFDCAFGRVGYLLTELPQSLKRDPEFIRQSSLAPKTIQQKYKSGRGEVKERTVSVVNIVFQKRKVNENAINATINNPVIQDPDFGPAAQPNDFSAPKDQGLDRPPGQAIRRIGK